MKFDTPADDQSDRPQEGRSASRRRPHRRPAQDHRHRALRLRAPRRRAEPGVRLRARRGDRQGPHRARSTSRRAKASPGVLAVVTGENRRQARQGQDCNIARLLGGPEIQHYHQAVARRGRRDFRTGARRRRAGPASTTTAAGPFDLAAQLKTAPSRPATAAKAAGAAGAARRRFRGRVRGRAGQDRRRPTPRPTRATR